jgi:hypothetical protein
MKVCEGGGDLTSALKKDLLPQSGSVPIHKRQTRRKLLTSLIFGEPSRMVDVAQSAFTEHSGIPAINACWLEQHSKALRMSDAKCSIFNRR